MRIYWFTVLLLASSLLRGQQVFFADARAVSLGRVLSVLGDGFWAGNPASWVEQRSALLALQAAMPYGLPALNISGIGAADVRAGAYWRVGLLSGGQASVYRYGRWMLGYARPLQSGWSVGLRMAYLWERYRGYAAESGLSVEVGLRWQPSDSWVFGCLWRPYEGGGLHSASLNLGVMRRFEENLLLVFGLDQSADGFLPSWRLGVEYGPVDLFCFRLGLSSSARANEVGGGRLLRLHGGLGYSFGAWLLDVAVEYHPYLGFTPMLNLQRQIRGR